MQSELGSPLHSQILTRNKYNVFKQDESRTVYLLTIQKSFSYCRIPYLLTPYTVLLTSYTSTFAELAFILDSCSNQQSPPERQPQAALQHRSPLPGGDVPLFSEININPCLQCFCDFTKKKSVLLLTAKKHQSSTRHLCTITPLEQGVRRSAEWYTQQKHLLADQPPVSDPTLSFWLSKLAKYLKEKPWEVFPPGTPAGDSQR